MLRLLLVRALQHFIVKAALSLGSKQRRKIYVLLRRQIPLSLADNQAEH